MAAKINVDVSLKAKLEATLTAQLKAKFGDDIGSVAIVNINAKGEAKVR